MTLVNLRFQSKWQVCCFLPITFAINREVTAKLFSTSDRRFPRARCRGREGSSTAHGSVVYFRSSKTFTIQSFVLVYRFVAKTTALFDGASSEQFQPSFRG